MQGQRIRLLLIEDDKVDQMAFKRLVEGESLPYDYVIAGSVAKAQDLMQSDQFDVVIADYTLGDGTAFDLFDLVSETPVVFVTGGGDEEIAVKAMKLGAYDYLIKDRERNYLKILPVTVENAIRSKRSDEQYRMLSHAIMSIHESVYITNMQGRITFVNQEFLDTYGYSQKQIVGMKEDVLWRDQSLKEQFNRPLQGSSGSNATGEVIHIRKDGQEIPVFLSTSVIKDHKGRGMAVVSIARDHTEKKRAEEEKELMQAQLLQAQKMEAIGVLTGGVAHDFNNLITAISGCAELVMMEIDESNPIFRDMKHIQDSGRRAAELTRQLLLFSRKHPISLKPISLNTVIDHLNRMLHRLIGEDIVILTDLEADLWSIMADSSMMDQVIMNIVINARDVMPDGGQITIQTKNVVLDGSKIKRMAEAEEGRFVLLSISDTGTGMDQNTIQHVFEPFFSTKGPGRGTGLGLSVVYGIVKQHKGWIDVYSEIGHGTEFKIFLPMVPFKPEDASQKRVKECTGMGNGERVLLVEDERDVCNFAKRALERNGYRVFTAECVGEALDIFNKEAGEFHLVFSDVVLPDRSGVDLVEELLSIKPDLNVLMSSGYTDHKSRWPAIQEKGLPFLSKPYALNEMIDIVNQLVTTGEVA